MSQSLVFLWGELAGKSLKLLMQNYSDRLSELNPFALKHLPIRCCNIFSLPRGKKKSRKCKGRVYPPLGTGKKAPFTAFWWWHSCPSGLPSCHIFWWTFSTSGMVWFFYFNVQIVVLGLTATCPQTSSQGFTTSSIDSSLFAKALSSGGGWRLSGMHMHVPQLRIRGNPQRLIRSPILMQFHAWATV